MKTFNMGWFVKLGGEKKGPFKKPIYCNSIEEFGKICLLEERKEKIEKLLNQHKKLKK